MAQISAFRGTRYNSDLSSDLSLLISPPYDVISQQRCEQLHQQSPFNYVRLVLGRELSEDTEAENRFTRSAEFVRQWLSEGVLITDDKPSLYRQRISYTLDQKTFELSGVTASVRLSDYSENVVLPHEKTLQGPKEGLAKLLTSTRANLDSVWFMYEDNAGAVAQALARMAWHQVAGPAVDSQGVSYSLDRCDDPRSISELADSLISEQLVIADGHHRYETALAYSMSQPATERPSPSDWVMGTLVWTDDPGLSVLPTHRVIKDMPPEVISSVAEKLRDRYEISAHSIGEMTSALPGASEPVFGWADSKQAWLARPRSETDDIGAQCVQDDILAGIFGFDVANLKTDPRILYVEQASDAIGRVQSGEYQLAFILKPIEVRTITRYASQNRCMPQKSTYFYPKLASGLVFRRFEDNS